MTNWIKIPSPGTQILDGRWLCVVDGPRPTFRPKVAFCELIEGDWYGDDGELLAEGFIVTHVANPPQLPLS